MLGRKEAIAFVLDLVGDSPVIHCNGYLCRESFALRDRTQNFYMIGSMGMASSIGLGVALARPDRKVFVFDGDGNVLMNLGALATIGATGPENLCHIVFDNGAYASTGYQKTLSDRVALEKVASAAGYRIVRRAEDQEGLRASASELFSGAGPAFLLVRTDPKREDNRFGRITHSPEEITHRFMKAL
jgi:thiamine pyrophosphate-dependent acetolactate synthase large subunit-like protein